YLLLGILHDVGKTLSLTGEDDFYVDGSNLILSCPAEHAGLDACVVTYSHDEFGYQKFLECCPGVDLPEEFLYGVRYHSLHSVDSRWLSEKDVQNFAWLFDDFTVYDHGTKNGLNTPPLEVMLSARRLVDKWFPGPIVCPPSLKSQTPLVPQIEGISDAVDEAAPEGEARSIGLKQKIRDLQRTVETEVVSTGVCVTFLRTTPLPIEVLTARKELAVLRGQETEMNKQKSDRAPLSEEERRCIERVKRDVLASYDEFFDGLERSFMRSQRNENKRLLSQVQHLKADNASLQLMVSAALVVRVDALEVSERQVKLGKGLPCSSLMLSQTVAFSWIYAAAIVAVAGIILGSWLVDLRESALTPDDKSSASPGDISRETILDWTNVTARRIADDFASGPFESSKALLNTLRSDTYGGYVGARVKSVPGLSKEERGLFARKKFAKGDVVMQIPRTAWYSQADIPTALASVIGISRLQRASPEVQRVGMGLGLLYEVTSLSSNETKGWLHNRLGKSRVTDKELLKQWFNSLPDSFDSIVRFNTNQSALLFGPAREELRRLEKFLVTCRSLAAVMPSMFGIESM
ncbi:hypothetical protein FOZ62_025649, partial [Perkinsus olseni]